MRISTSLKTLAIAAGMLLTANATEAKLVKPSTYTNDVVIGKVYYAGAKDANNKNYLNGRYIELYNISTDTLDISGMYIGLVESDAKANAWTAERLTEAHKDSVALKQLFRIPANAKMDPYSSIVIANSAIDHSANGENFPNLSDADFEAKDTQGKVTNNDNVPALELVYTAFSSISNMNLAQGGACAVVLLTQDTKTEELTKTFSYGKEKGNEYVLLPKGKVIDGVEIVKTGEAEEGILRLDNSLDAGNIAITSKTGYNGEIVYRKTAYVVGGKTVLFDTNNSTVDFAISTTIQPRQYDTEASGLTAQSITIPESGYLAINMEQPFCGPKNMLFCFVNATNKDETTDLKYMEIPGDSTLLMKGDWIVIAKPGTYDLLLSASQGVMKQRTSCQAWSDEDTKTMKQTNRRYYKFMNTTGKVGFQRVPKTAEGYYNVADCSDGNRLVITITDAIGERIFAANGAASWDELEFIPWHGSTPEQAAANVQGIAVQPVSNGAIYDLQGRRVIKPLNGIYVKDGKKMIIK